MTELLPQDERHAYCVDGVTLKHTESCRMVFGRLDPDNCARCEERAVERELGIPARADHARRDEKAAQEAQDAEGRRYHFANHHRYPCGQPGAVCTAFDW